MKIKITNILKIENVPEDLLSELKERLTFANPKWLENQKRGYWNGQTSRMLRFYDELDGGEVELPRGFIRQLLSLYRREDVTFHIEDARRTLPEVDFTFGGELRSFQREAVKEILERDFGTLSAPTGSGKTVMALYLIAKRKQPCLPSYSNIFQPIRYIGERFERCLMKMK